MVSYHMTDGSRSRKSSVWWRQDKMLIPSCLITRQMLGREWVMGMQMSVHLGVLPKTELQVSTRLSYRTLKDENAEETTFCPRWRDLKSLSLSGRDMLLTHSTPHQHTYHKIKYKSIYKCKKVKWSSILWKWQPWKEKSLLRIAEQDLCMSGNYDRSIWTMMNGMTLWEPNDPVGSRTSQREHRSQIPQLKSIPYPPQPTPAKHNERAD